ncbi:hypothetical protein V7S43_007923 [Phytophthora oleae]|uniref:Transcription elongation factor Eaf N-terminal domain-containing protein n=1 Tax=Phytophthora oleae TaxID=2107226 RepID=A0ABD3FJ82_9STRA
MGLHEVYPLSELETTRAASTYSMIVPTRFGLKYAPIPTLALEYEDDLMGVVDATSDKDASLYVYRDGSSAPSLGPSRKLHVVELPTLTRTSETQQITRQLQQDNGRFLAPGVVSEGQLKRLLDRLVQNLPEANEEDQIPPSLTVDRQVNNAPQEDESELEESAMEDSVMEESVVEASQSEEGERSQTKEATTTEVNPNRGSFVTHEDESEGEAETEAGVPKVGDIDAQEDSRGSEADEGNSVLATEKEQHESEGEAQEDAKKTKALRSESDVSEEEVQSEELEYFSEDGSDEDSF